MIHMLLLLIYMAFISLGLPDSMLGCAWPSMYGTLNVPVSYAGLLSMIIALGTVISSLNSDRLTRRLGTGRVTAYSVALTAVALFGFSISNSFWMLILWAVPYGLGAGSVDAALNNYVALHYESRHMSWLHCMWGVGTLIGPYVMGYALSNGMSWHKGYQTIGIIQAILCAILLFSIPLWNKKSNEAERKEVRETNRANSSNTALTLKNVIQIEGVKDVMIAFFCYCALEQTVMLWASSYMVLHNKIAVDLAASLASLFFIGITAGRAMNGFMTMKFSDSQMIRAGQGMIAMGLILMLLPFGNIVTILALGMIGLGCAPIYPCIIHSTPIHFGRDKSQAVIGVQMACAYVGTCVMPPLFGLIANHISVTLFPIYLMIILLIMVIAQEHLERNADSNSSQFHKMQSKIKEYDRENVRPVLRCSICTGEQTAGFQNIHTGQIEEVMLITNKKQLNEFMKMYGIDHIEKIY